MHLESAGYRGSYFILNFEYIRQFAVVAIRPKMNNVASVNQLRRHAKAAARATDAALQNRPDIQRCADLSDVLLLAPENERGSARNHLQSARPSEKYSFSLS